MKLRPLHLGNTPGGEPVYLSPEERTMGVHAEGTVGVGKSALANYMIEQDQRYLPGGGLVVDPHGNDPGSLYEQALARATRFRSRRPIYFVNLSLPEWVYGFHIFARREGVDLSTRVQRCVRHLFTAWNEPDPYERPRTLFWSTNGFTVGMERGDVGLTELRAILEYERGALRSYLTSDTSVAGSWRQLSRKRLDQFDEQIESTRNRLNALTSAAGPRRFLSLIHPPAMLDFRDLLARRAWVFVNLQSSPYLDREHARVIGTLLIADFLEAGCQRRPSLGGRLAPTALYIDEAHMFVNHDLAMAFEECRKFQIYTTVMHQHLQQLRQDDERVLHAVLSCARTKVLFALGSDVDAKQLVHEVFVGPGGIDYAEVKHVQPQTKFRPIAARDQSVTKSRGGGSTHTDAHSDQRSRSRGRSYGSSHTHTLGSDAGASQTVADAKSVARGRTITTGTTDTRSVTATHTTGRGTNRSVADGVAEGDVKSVSRTIGRAHSTGHSHTSGPVHTTGTTRTTTLQWDPKTGVVTHVDTTSQTTSVTTGEASTVQNTDTQSESTTDGESQTTVRSKVHTYGETDNESDAESWSQSRGETESQSETETKSKTRTRSTTHSRSRSESDADTDTRTESDTDTTGTGKTVSDAHTTNWATAVTDAPITRHEEFREDAVEFFTLEEQRQRKADALRCQPRATCIVRRPDCSNVEVRVPFRQPLRVPIRLLRAYEANNAAKTGAVSPAQADAMIAERYRHLEARAVSFDQQEPQDLHSLDTLSIPPVPYDDAIDLTPRRTRSPFSKPGRKPRPKSSLPGDAAK